MPWVLLFGTQCPAAAGSSRVLAIFKPVASAASLPSLRLDLSVLKSRLRALGVGHDSVLIRQRTIVVSGSSDLPVPASDLATVGDLYLRPALCGAPAFDGAASGTAPPPAGCPPQYQLVISNFNGSIAPSSNVAPDPELANYGTTLPTQDVASATVLLHMLGSEPSGNFGTYPRLLLGPAQVTGRAVKRASATYSRVSGGWLLTMTFTNSGSEAWNAMAQESFHEVIGFDFDGIVVSAPVIEPNQATFLSFGSSIQTLLGHQETVAKTIAAALDSGPLSVALAAEEVRSK